MASDFQRRKVAGVFNAMDVDNDGFLEREDFAALTERWVETRADRERVTTIMMGWWDVLLAASDLNRDNKVTLDEVLLVVDRLPTMLEAVTATADAMFEAIDENADGRIDAGEYRRLIETWNGVETNTDAIFPKLDLDGDGCISHKEFTELWTEFWVGDNPDSPGSLVFGPVRTA
jgi:Ca2+-binding EF-hand superfamily protein